MKNLPVENTSKNIKYTSNSYSLHKYVHISKIRILHRIAYRQKIVKDKIVETTNVSSPNQLQDLLTIPWEVTAQFICNKLGIYNLYAQA